MSPFADETANTADREILSTRIFDAPRELVYEAWTDPARVAKWWGPNGFTTTILEMDVRPGGSWRLIMHGPDGTDYPNHIVYQELVRPERIVYVHGGASLDEPGSFHVTVSFAALGNRTELTMRMVFRTPGERDTVVEKYGAIEGNRQTLGRLSDFLSKVPTWAKEAENRSGLVITRVFEAPRNLVWKAWTVPERLMKWWGPEGYSSPASSMDLRVGGKYLNCMRGPDGRDYWTCGVFLEIEPEWLLVYTDNFSDSEGNVVGSEQHGLKVPFTEDMIVRVVLEDLDGRTRMTLSHSGIPEGEMKEGTVIGWQGSFDKLAKSLAT